MCIETLIQSKLSYPGTKLHFPIFKNRAYFSVTSIALNNGNIRGGNVIKTFAQEICTGQKFEIVSLLQIKEK